MDAEDRGKPIRLEVTIDPRNLDQLLDRVRQIVENAIGSLSTKGGGPAAQPSNQQATLDSSPQKSASDSKGLGAKQSDPLKAADLRTALLLGKLPDDTSLLIDVKTLAALLKVSSRSVFRFVDEGAVPDPVRLGTLVRWRLAEILEWIECGCPPRQKWRYEGSASKRRASR